MSANNRTQLINKLYKVAKKHYTPIAPTSSRSVLEHILYGCCLENSRYVAADEAFARMEEGYFDWNEVRVTTTAELAETLKGLADPTGAAVSVKKTLHGIFETYYKFDLDFLKKENLRKTIQQFEKFRGVSPFVVAYAAQVALAGHSIPIDDATMQLMYVLGIVSQSEADKGRVPGLERTIAKNKGVEFASVVHQLAADFYKSPNNKDFRAILVSIAPDAKDRFPKRGGAKKKTVEKTAEPEPVEPKTDKTKVKVSKPTKKKAAKAATADKKAATKKSAVTKKPATKAAAKKPVKKSSSAAPRKSAGKTTTSRKKAPAKKKPATSKANVKKASSKKKSNVKKKTTKKTTAKKKKSPTRSLAKKKPR